MNDWISVDDRLPDDGQTVLVYGGGFGIAEFIKGISLSERELMEQGKIENPKLKIYSFGGEEGEVLRSNFYNPGDEGFGNARPYRWRDTTTGEYKVGQSVKYWMQLPPIPENDGDYE